MEYDILYSTISDADHTQIEQFNCGNGALNRYLKRDAYFETVQHVAHTTLIVFDNCDGEQHVVAGFYTMKFQHMQFDDDKLIYPVAHLKCMAIAKKFQTHGYGTHVLHHIIAQSISLSKFIGCRALALDAVTECEHFYRRVGFESIHHSQKNVDTVKMFFDFRDKTTYDKLINP